MIIKEMLIQDDKEFKAIFTCEFCDNHVIKRGYNNKDFHDNIIPNVKCEKCGKTRNKL